ncbi:MAG: TIGR03617 family F420-dependent LLM class oxidoreductase [Anaerolineales bacterium]|nr:TIGR03617 family F420-dependent LLM class oxidoreductase [Anaerolineales bacterium]
MTLLLDAVLPPLPLAQAVEAARAAEAAGFAALWTMETSHDPFLPCALIAEHTRRLQFGTGIAVAFARSPATLAYTAWDLAQASQGRFILGLGTQVREHVVRRFGMPWPDSVTGKLREQIGAARAFWHAWQEGEPLNFRGEHYKLTLMTPFFNPGPIPNPLIPIYVAGVNAGLARLAGEVADGFLVHPLHTLSYLKEVILPAVRGGARSAGRGKKAIPLSVSVFAITSPEERELVRSQIAFYASTPSYRPVMAQHGWQETAARLSHLAARGQWGEMPALIDEAMLAELAVQAAPGELAGALLQRYAGIAARVTLYTPYTPGERQSFWRQLVKDLENQ